ncbi:MAG: non-homologous end-joining DNA ligase [Propioniciclava sp.]|uniref:non-homologous end-joining DNA ligase n=1 Tax=Propioniciclava sp. TaxID=2038686 RepID=UPI0039E2AAF5
MADVTTTVEGRTLKLTNLDKQLYPSGFTKGEVIEYYRAIAPVLLPHLDGRPVTRIRFPNGTADKGFFEKNAPAGAPEWLRILHTTGADGDLDYPVIDTLPALIYMANLAALELHAHQWKVSARTKNVTVDKNLPVDQLVIDLDPGEGVTMPLIATAALLMAGELGDAGLTSYAKTSGGKGIQVYSPLVRTPAGRVLDWARELGERLAAQHPALFVTAIAKEARVGKILIDVNQNLPGRTTVAPYSLRARDEPTVSTPLRWEEVEAATDGAPLRFTASDVLARVESGGDLFADLLGRRRGTLPD